LRAARRTLCLGVVPFEPELYPWISLAAIAWGLLDCFFGYRVFKVTVALVGALAGGLLAQAAVLALGFDSTVELAALFVGALGGAALAFLLYLAAVFVAGFGFGATLAVLLLAHFNHMVALLVAIVTGVIGGVAAVKLQKVLIVLATALLGSFRALVAVTYFTAGLDWVYYYRQPQQFPALIDGNGWMFPAILVLAAVGAMAQFELGRDGGGKGDAKKKK
jgi:hypothetical protein